MNAYELADELLRDNTQLTVKAAYMLRQQADRIAELESLYWQQVYKNIPPQTKPVAWMQMHYKDNIPTKFSPVKVWEDDIPLYTTPQTKPLSDEEIIAIRDSCYVQSGIDEWEFDDVNFARAIEERHGIK